MQIIAGKHRGRKLDIIRSQHIRPTGARTREAIFNIIQHGEASEALIDQPVADIYCGSGAMGLEALSRGASHITFVDQAQESLRIAQKNAAKLHEEDNAVFIKADATELPPAATPFALLFLDPPYHKFLVTPTLRSLMARGWVKEGSMLIVETSDKENFKLPVGYMAFDERTYGNSKVTLVRCEKVILADS